MASTVKKKKPATKAKPAKKQTIKKVAHKAPPKSGKTKGAKKTITKKSSAKKAVLKLKPAPKKSLTQAHVTPKPGKHVLKTSKTISLKVGDRAPPFSMPATRIGEVSNQSLKGKAYVLYFYPKDDTSGCTAEACEFRNSLPAFEDLSATIIGVSKDNLESHEKFSRKYNLPFPLAYDETGDVCESFGTWVEKSMYGRTYMGIERATFLVDAQGVIRAIWHKVSVSGHVDEVKKAVAALPAQSQAA